MKQLPHGFQAIYDGTSGHTAHKRHAYLMLWIEQGLITELPKGYVVPDPKRVIKKSRLPLGDAVAKVTTAVGITPCGSCKERQKDLNDFGDKLISVSEKLVKGLLPQLRVVGDQETDRTSTTE